jgi:hypothetical protein
MQRNRLPKVALAEDTEFIPYRNNETNSVDEIWWNRPFINLVFFSFSFSLGGVRLSPLGMSATVGLLDQPRMIDDDYGAVGGMRIGRGNRSTRRKPAPVPLCPPQIPHDLTWDRTRAATVGSRQLTAWAMARPFHKPKHATASHSCYVVYHMYCPIQLQHRDCRFESHSGHGCMSTFFMCLCYPL